MLLSSHNILDLAWIWTCTPQTVDFYRWVYVYPSVLNPEHVFEGSLTSSTTGLYHIKKYKPFREHPAPNFARVMSACWKTAGLTTSPIRGRVPGSQKQRPEQCCLLFSLLSINPVSKVYGDSTMISDLLCLRHNFGNAIQYQNVALWRNNIDNTFYVPECKYWFRFALNFVAAQLT